MRDKVKYLATWVKTEILANQPVFVFDKSYLRKIRKLNMF